MHAIFIDETTSSHKVIKLSLHREAVILQR